MRISLTKKEKVRRRNDLNRVFCSNQKADCKGLKILYIENGLMWNRIVICPIKRYKKAVERNREKRVCREIYRSIKQNLKKGFDLAFIIYPGDYSFSERTEQVTSLLNRIGLLR